MGRRGSIASHGFRSTFSDWASGASPYCASTQPSGARAQSTSTGEALVSASRDVVGASAERSMPIASAIRFASSSRPRRSMASRAKSASETPGPDRARRRWRRRKRWPIARRCAHGPEVDLVGRPGADEIVAGTGWLVRRGQRAAVRLLARGDRFRASVRPAARTPPPPRSTRVLPGRRGFRSAPSRRCTGSPRSAPADAPPSTCASNAFTSHNVLW